MADDSAARPSATLRLAPRLGQFRCHAGEDPVDQIQFLAERGFKTIHDCRFRARPPSEQSRIANEVDRLGLSFGTIVGPTEFSWPKFASGSAELRRDVLAELDEALDAARQVPAAGVLIVPGRRDPSLPWERQWINSVDLMRRCAGRCEEAGIPMLLEPIGRGDQRPSLVLWTLGEALRMCRDVGSSHCRVLCDVYRWCNFGKWIRPLDELVPILERDWGHIGAVSVADAPGGKEPGTGCLDYAHLFRFLAARGFRGPVTLDHGPDQPGLVGETAVLAAYDNLMQQCDRPFSDSV